MYNVFSSSLRFKLVYLDLDIAEGNVETTDVRDLEHFFLLNRYLFRLI